MFARPSPRPRFILKTGLVAQFMSSPAASPTGPRAPGPPPSTSLFAHLGQDAPAGLVVFLVALPLCLGISLASGAPLLAGVVAGIVGGVVVSLLSGSHVSVSGPAAGLTIVMLSAIATLGSFAAVLTATAVAGYFSWRWARRGRALLRSTSRRPLLGACWRPLASS